ncbi:MAG: IMP dehydrogenase [Phycisphaerales bacterium]|nr:IMP dehydrogenase [Phycisphaerales bacterium]
MENRIKIIGEGITFDDVLLVPNRSDFVPSEADVKTRITRTIELTLPLVSAPMDTVTEAALAIALAQEGGIGCIHKNMSIEHQCREVEKVKRSANGIITDPVTLPPDETVGRARQIMKEQHISGIPIVLGTGGELVGILTRRDLKFHEGDDHKPIRELMTKSNLVTAPPDTSLENAEVVLNNARVEKLLLVDDKRRLKGMITMRDIEKTHQFPRASKDARGRLRVGAAVGVRQYDRVEALIQKGVDLVVVDTAHGHSSNVIDSVREIKHRFGIDVVAGNIATTDAANDLIAAGADALKVGIGPGSICTTRIVSGVGVPQITAIMNVVAAAAPAGIPVIADGGIRHSGDITKALAVGASAVMMGSLFAGLDESPGDLVIRRGRRFKSYRGMGSMGAMVQGSADRYGQAGVRQTSKLVPEGVEGLVHYRGPLGDFVYQMIGGLRAGMGYCGAKTIDELHAKARFVKVSHASMVESHPHDITITRESPNYYTSDTAMDE